MTSVEAFFKFFALIQILLFIVLFVVTLSYKIWKDYETKQQKKWIKQIHKLLTRFDKISPAELFFLKKRRVLAFKVFFQLEKEDSFVDNVLITNILINLFLPYLSEDVASLHWPSRNRAAMLLQLKNKFLKTLSVHEEAYLLKLMADSIRLVSLNAAIAVCFSPTQKMLDVLIDIFNQNRRSQYEFLTMMTSHAAYRIIPLIQARLIREKDIYTRVFCYRMLRQLPKMEISNPFIKSDLNSEHLDLRLAALAYIAYIEKPHFKDFLIEGLQSIFWEVRARAAKLIGYTRDEHLVPFLEPLLQDKVWWVRFRAAEALSLMGKTGMNVLKAQKIKIDKFANEIAQQQIEFYKLKKTIL
ncbi:MAG: HEAT repeat domain-containing protein [Gammaproteobacteria bacterium]|nr:HEAT repeat domain-containing protein [Gammaproteobacteria bacterium]